MEPRYPPPEDFPRMDLDRIGRTPWDPVPNADGTYPPTPLIYRLYFGIFDKRYRRGGIFNPKD